MKFTRRLQDFLSGVGTDTTHFTNQCVVIPHTADYPDAYLQPTAMHYCSANQTRGT